MAGKPLLRTLIFAERVEENELTNLITAHDVFDRVTITDARNGATVPLCVLFCMAEVSGHVAVELRFTDLANNEVLLTRRFAVLVTDQIVGNLLALPVGSMHVPHPGVYAWDLLWENEIIGTGRIYAESSDTPASESGGSI